jgi:hypothetical protein
MEDLIRVPRRRLRSEDRNVHSGKPNSHALYQDPILVGPQRAERELGF